jgi:hypothetical protein
LFPLFSPLLLSFGFTHCVALQEIS